MVNNAVALPLSRVFPAVAENYGRGQEIKLRYFLGTIGLRDQDSLVLTPDANGATAAFELKDPSGKAFLKGFLRFGNAGKLDFSVTNQPDTKTRFSIVPPNVVPPNKEGPPAEGVVRFLATLSLGDAPFATPPGEEAKLLLGAKELYKNPKPYEKTKDLERKIANQKFFAELLLAATEGKWDEEEIKADYAEWVGKLERKAGDKEPDADLEQRAYNSSRMIGTMVNHASAAKACATIGKCLIVQEFPSCSSSLIPNPKSYYIYRGAEVYSEGNSYCEDPKPVKEFGGGRKMQY